jgi:hypothetical protein
MSAVNCDLDKWEITWEGNNSNAQLRRQYEFDLSVTDKDNNPINGATVTLKDKNGDTVFSLTTDLDGKIPTQTVMYAHYEEATGSTPNLYSPFHLRIEKGGYERYDDHSITLDKKTELKIALMRYIVRKKIFGQITLKEVVIGTVKESDLIAGTIGVKDVLNVNLTEKDVIVGTLIEKDHIKGEIRPE